MRRDPQRGFTLVEAMAGMAIGLVVVAAALALLSASTHEARRGVAETRVAQDLRHAAVQVARGLARAGHWGGAGRAVGDAALANPYAAFTAGAGTASWHYSRDAAENGTVDGNEQFGLRLRGGVVELRLGAAGWQAMTDAGTLTVTTLDVEPTVVETPLPEVCEAPCAAGSITCPPRHRSRALRIAIAGHAPQVPAVVRSAATDVRLRNDLVVGACD